MIILQSAANSGVITYTLTDVATGNVASGSLSSDVPANTVFLSCAHWINNGSTASATAMGIMQFVGETRY